MLLWVATWPVIVAAESVPSSFEARAAEASALRDKDATQGLALADRVLTEAQTAGDRRGVAAAQLARGENLNVLSRNEESLAALEDGLKIYQALGDRLGEALAHRKIGVAHYDLNQFDLAIDAYHAALRLLDDAGQAEERAKTLANIGNVYRAMGDLERSVAFQEQAIEMFEAAGHQLGVAGTSLNLGALHRGMASELQDSQPEQAAVLRGKARALTQRALAGFEALDIPRGMASALGNLAAIESDGGNRVQSLAWQRRALAIRREVGDRAGEARSLRLIGDLLVELKQPAPAMEALTESVALAREMTLPEEELAGLWTLSELLDARGEHQAAIERLHEWVELSARQRQQERETRVVELQEQYDAERKTREIETLRFEKERERLQAENQAARARLYLLVGVVLAMLLLFMLYRARIKDRVARKLDQAARTDHLTGLANRRDATESLHRLAANASQSWGLLLIDVDDFKRVNDSIGHEAGDAVLSAIAGRLKSAAGQDDLVARWGGEEFIVASSAGSQLQMLAENVRTRVSRDAIKLGDRTLAVSVTVGAAVAKPGEPSNAVLDALRRADAALLQGKREGKNRMVVA